MRNNNQQSGGHVMSKQSIKWHEKCLMNYSKTLLKLTEEIASLKEKARQSFNQGVFYLAQIDEAKLRNMDGFDRKKLLMKRKIK
jgi:hypothetical protein